MNVVKRIVKTFFALALIFSMFAGSGMTAKAEEATEEVEVTLELIYIGTDGNNYACEKTVSVEKEMKLKDFLAGYVLDGAMEGTVWETRNYYSDDTVIDSSMNLSCFGVPSGYERVEFIITIWQDGEYVDSGVGYEVICPSEYEDFSEEKINYIKNNVAVQKELKGFFEQGATCSVVKREYDNGNVLHEVKIELSSSSEPAPSPKPSNSDKKDDKVKVEVNEEPVVVEVPQTPENNYVVFHEDIISKVDMAIAEMAKLNAGQGEQTGQKTIEIDTGVWISFNRKVYQKMQESGLPVQIKFTYKGERYCVNIPAGADLLSLVDENGFCGFLNLMAHFGGTKL